MKNLTLVLGAGAMIAIGAHTASAGPDKVQIPAGYASSYVKIATIDRYDNKTVRVVYMNPEAWQAARPNQPLPDGTTLILEMRAAKLGADGQPTLDKDGRFIADDKVSALAVQQKKRGFGAEYPEAFRNPDWEYAVFEPDFKLRASAATQPCMQCHKPRAKDDYTMVAARIVNEQKKK